MQIWLLNDACNWNGLNEMGKNYQVKGHIISFQIDKTSFGGQFNLKWKVKLSNFHVISIN